MIINGTQLLKLMQCKLDMFEHHRCTTKCNIKRRDHQIQVNTTTMAMELVKLAKLDEPSSADLAADAAYAEYIEDLQND